MDKGPNYRHGESWPPTKEYRTWKGLRRRCDPTSKDAPRYHDRGIRVCDRWATSYESFLQDVGRAPAENAQIERNNNDGPYSPENCRWASPKEQGNNKRNNRFFYIDGVRLNIREAARILECNTATIWEHMQRGKTWDWIVGHFRERLERAAQ